MAPFHEDLIMDHADVVKEKVIDYKQFDNRILKSQVFYCQGENQCMIKAVIFDMGGVIIDVNPYFGQILQVFEPECEEEFWEKINVEAAPLCRGETTLMEFWRSVAEKCGKNVPDEVLETLWVIKGEPSLNKGIEDIIRSLKNKYKLAILSNTMREHEVERKGIFALFDEIILSYEVGLTKDDRTIFLLAADRLGVNPEECVFIDDIKQFVEVAQTVGMKALLFENAEKLRVDLRKWGITM